MLKKYDLIFNFVNGKSIKIQKECEADEIINDTIIEDFISDLYKDNYYCSRKDNIIFAMDKVTYIQYFEVKDGNRKQTSDIQDK